LKPDTRVPRDSPDDSSGHEQEGYSPSDHEERGDEFYLAGEWEAAANAYRIASDGGNVAALVKLGLSLEALGDGAGASSAYNRAASAGDAQGLLQVAFERNAANLPVEALELATRAAALGDSLAAAVRATWLWDETHDPQLESELKAGIDIYESARSALAELWTMVGRFGDARQLLTEGAEEGELDCLVPLAALLLSEFDEDEEGRQWLREASARGDGHASHSLAMRVARDGDVQQARTLLRRALEQGDSDAQDDLRALDAGGSPRT
jgi:TPR repeat protein